LKIQFETAKKDKEIELLNKDNEIKSLQLGHQQASLLASRLKPKKIKADPADEQLDGNPGAEIIRGSKRS